MKKMDKGVINTDGTIGFIHTDDFDGQITKIPLIYLKQLMKFLDTLDEMGFDVLEIGVKNNYPLLLFLDKGRKTALAMAPRMGDD